MKTYQQLVAEAKAQVKEVDVATLLSVLNQQNTVVIDIREPEEYQQGHIENVVNYPRGVLESKMCQHPCVQHHAEPMAALEDMGNKSVYLICRSGARTALAAQSLHDMGFSDVISVAGGMLAWEESGYPVEK